MLMGLVACGGGGSSDSVVDTVKNPDTGTVKPEPQAQVIRIQNVSVNTYQIALDLNTIAKQFNIPDAKLMPYKACGSKNLNFDNVVVILKNRDIEKNIFAPVNCDNKAEVEISMLDAGRRWSVDIVVMNNNELLSSKNILDIQPNLKIQKNIIFQKDMDYQMFYKALNQSDLASLYESNMNPIAPYENIDPQGYIHLMSSPNDYVGGGKKYTYSRPEFKLSYNQNKMNVRLNGFDGRDATANFVLPEELDALQVGLYANLLRYPIHNEIIGGLDWSGNGAGCNTSNSWLRVDQITYESNEVRSIDFSFAQHCEKDPNSALFARIHWISSDKSLGFNWQPNLATIPTGNYIALESDSADYIGGGNSYLYSASNARIQMNNTGNLISVALTGDTTWTGEFQLPDSKTKF